MTLEQAKELGYGDVMLHNTMKKADGTPRQFRVTGKVKTWKRDSNRIRVPLKHGLYEYGYLTNNTFEGGGFTLNLDEVEIV